MNFNMKLLPFGSDILNGTYMIVYITLISLAIDVLGEGAQVKVAPGVIQRSSKYPWQP